MSRPRIIFVDGIVGAGKSTMTGFIARQLQINGIEANRVSEGGELTIELWPRPPRMGVPVRYLGRRWAARRVVAKPRRALDRLLDRWRELARRAQEDDKVRIFDGHLFHGVLDEIQLIDGDPSVARSFSRELVSILEPLNPVLVHLDTADISATVLPVCSRRGSAWTRHQVEWKVPSPYGREQGLAGFEGLLRLFGDLVARSRGLARELEIPFVSLGAHAGSWAERLGSAIRFLRSQGLPIPEEYGTVELALARAPHRSSRELRFHPDMTDLGLWRGTGEIEENLVLHGNPVLRSLEGLERTRRIGGDISIADSPELRNLDPLREVRSIGGGFFISHCAGLRSLSGLEGLSSISGSLSLTGNERLEELGSLETFEVGEQLALLANRSLASLDGLQSLRTLRRDLTLSDLDALTSLSGLDGLEQVGEHVAIGYNENLVSLSGLERLTSVGGPLLLIHNPRLRSLGALSSLGRVGDVYIIENAALTDSEIGHFTERLRNAGHQGRVVAVANGASYDPSVEREWCGAGNSDIRT